MRKMISWCAPVAVLLVWALSPAPASAIDICGNNYCANDGIETCQTCPQDCGQCPSDSDGDGVNDPYDNCPSTYNPSQANCDGDGQGDACDAENANYQQTTLRTCHISGQEGAVVRKYREALYEDVSSCNAPDDWRLYSQTNRVCFGLDPYTCCLNHFGSECYTHYNNNTCHY